MATLEKIRQKQGCLVAVIGFTLALFILTLTDLNPFQACKRGSSTEFSVGGVSVDKEEVDKVYENYTNNADKSQFNNDAVRQQIVAGLAQQALINKECEELGITASPSLLGQFVDRDQQLFYQLYTIMAQANPPVQLASMQQAKGLIDNPKGQDQQAIEAMKNAWVAREKEIDSYVKQLTFDQLISGLFTANNLDAKSVYNDNNSYSSVSYVYTNVNMADSVDVTDADRKAIYDNMKWQFYVPAYRATADKMQNQYNPNYQPTNYFEEPVRLVDVAAIFIQPSLDDKAKTYGEFIAFVDTLSKTNDLIPTPQSTSMQPIEGFAANLKDNRSLQQILGVDAETLAGILASDSVYRLPSTASDMQHAAIKVTNIEDRVDSVQASFRLALGAAPADSVEALQYWILPGTQNAELFNGLASEYMRLIPNLESDAGINAFQQMMAKVNDLVLTADVKAPVEYTDTVNNMHVVMTVDKRNPKTPFVSGTLYTAQAVPSGQTLLDLRTRLSSISTNAAAADLADSVRASNINYRDMMAAPIQMVSASSPYISLGGNNSIENSRQAVKWSMDKKVGDISPIFENNDVIYVVAIREAINDNFIPMNSSLIADYIDRLAKAKKQGDAQMADYTGSSLDDYAKAMGQEKITDNQFNLSGYGFLSSAPELSGKVAAAAPGTVVGPVVSGDRIVVFNVTEHRAPTAPFNAANYSREFINKFSPMQNPFMLLAGKNKVKNHGLNFILSDEELEQQQALQAKQQK